MSLYVIFFSVFVAGFLYTLFFSIFKATTHADECVTLAGRGTAPAPRAALNRIWGRAR